MTSKLFSLVILLALLALPALSTSSYKVTQAHKNSTYITLHLEYTGTDTYYGKPTSPIIKNLLFTFHMLSYNDFYFKIVDANNKRYEIPQKNPFPVDPLANFSFPISLAGVHFDYSENPFDFKITRKLNDAILFSTHGREFIYSDKYLEITTEIASDFVYGIGERFHESFRKKDGKWTVFNRDRGQVIDRGEGQQTYGYYPFYFLREPHYNLFHINYLRSSNAMDIIKSKNGSKHYITYKVIGGIFDFRFFLGEETPELTVAKMNFYAGRADVPPFWAMGFHQCRWGYNNVQALQNVLSNYEKNGLPLDTIWSDIDYMIDYQDFTIDQSRFPLDAMKNITDKYRYIPIIDAGIKSTGSAYEEGLKRKVYIDDASGQGPYFGKVWPGKTAFVDFFHPNATQYWQDMLDRLYQKVKFSGIWLDMNELANFCDGACEPPSGGSSTFDYSKDLPYHPGSDNIESHTISLNATHYGGLAEADVHAYSAFLETYATNQFLQSKNLKPFIITRSSTFGSSKYGFHWTGDNYASWEFLKGSIADNLNSQFFGFQMVGPDICGFGGNTTEELCSRWYQLGALYTFARSHNDHDSKSQEPYALGDTVLAAAKTNLKLRYSLLKYFYFLMVSNRGLGTIWKPMFFEFSFDQTAYQDAVVDTQFLVGPNLLAAPIVEQGKTSRRVYFPEVEWYDLYTGKTYGPGFQTISDVKLTDPVPLYLLEGSMIFTQKTENVVNTKQLDNTFTIVMGLAYNKYISNSTHDVYEAEGVMLSIKDYNNDSLVELCYRQGCDYLFNAVVTLTSHSRHLELDILYLGGIRLNQQILISDINLYFGQGKVSKVKLDKPLQVTGARREIINIPEPSQNALNLQAE